MRTTRWCATAFALGLAAAMVAGCACGGGAGGAGESGASAASGATRVTGTASYRERTALPDDAVLDVWITDITPGIITASVVTAEASVPTRGRQVPIPFTLDVPADRVVADHDYGLRAVLKSGGEELFTTDAPAPILTKGHGTQADVWLKRRGGGN